MMKKFTKGQTVEYFTNGNYTKGNITKLYPLCIKTWMGLIKVSNKELLRTCYVLMILLLPAFAQGQINGTLQKTATTGIVRGAFGSIGVDTLAAVRLTGITNGWTLIYNSATKKFHAAAVATADSTVFRTVANSRSLAQTQTALNLKANLANPTFTGTLTAADITTNNFLFNNNNANTVGAIAGNKPANIYSYGYNLSGSTSGMIGILGQAASGTYNFNLPITAGTSGQVLTSAGGVAAPMTWTTPATGTVTAIGVTTANGVSGTSSGGSTPNLTLTLGSITPSAVTSSGLVRGVGPYGLSSKVASNALTTTTGVSFDMLNSSSVDTRYATMQGVIVANNAGAEYGRAEIWVMANGSLLKSANFDQGGNLQQTGSVTASMFISNGVVRLKGYTVATLPAGTQGDTAFVTDNLTAPANGAVVAGGGSNVTPVFFNGTNWVVM